MKYCKKCIIPITRPEQVFNEEGVCDACSSAESKHTGIDWDARRSEFEKILERYRGDGSIYDCIIPVSGGKDSVSQALTMRDEFNMSPLCVNHLPCDLTEVGWKNLIFLRDLGFDVIHVGANRKAYREMTRIGFFKLGDCCWQEHIGIFTAPVRVAVQYRIPLLIWGENSQFEYGGPASKRENNYLDRNWLEQFQMLGYRISDVVLDGINLNDVKTFHYPTDEEMKDVGVTGLFLGYYTKWDSKKNANRAISLGWNRNPDGPVEGAYNDIENLDCKWIGGLHDYMKFIKFGFGRATDQLCIEIRAGRMSREEAIENLKNSSEGEVPWKFVPDFLEYLNISKEEFEANLDKFTNRRLFFCDDSGRLIKDSQGNLKRRYPLWEL
ncbi:MAG: pseudaminic acid biosynthesis protein PseA [Omnitrophica WOR_2 bacterium GWF2_38_59]|nr:MAG: pseudaminic acid biosynthesis protein PseA [Omnitrophica WOR_2 bacterium GWF2_38_59]OGX48234.1 MAG: pseudaminic acid biosynthesis protein PseA [Omnitrophica WOR_2 bacterium RIFOXYA2_FULL_38_17]OGX59601.1 MAG: pseudaminic acid biosynthesis protein PseA [Omnitrophica WOR_2 bacterium RIFOXYC2_FULL_38_12]OGX59993.1 MAG: pseudaminic acid biosynthesis protein PseA [Omnitrophica WOR_2 bacterium RIFOXYB2_FULL_38_16]